MKALHSTSLVVVFGVIALSTLSTYFLVTTLDTSNKPQLQLDVEPVRSYLNAVHRPQQLAYRACRDVEKYEERLGSWKRMITSVNSQTISMETALNKIVVASSSSIASVSGSSMRIMCIIPTVQPETRALKAYEIWGRKCDRVLFISNVAEIPGIDRRNILEVHPPNNDDKNNWQRLRAAIRHVHMTPELLSHDFFLIAGDDSFIILENLRKMLAEPYYEYLHHARTPMYLGHRMVQSGSNAAFVSGSALVLNQAALMIFASVSENTNCDPTVASESDDVLVAACFRHHNIYPLNTQDVFGEDRLHMFDAGGVASVIKDPNTANWYPPYRRKVMPKGLDGVSRYSFHFHGMWSQTMQEYADRIKAE